MVVIGNFRTQAELRKSRRRPFTQQAKILIRGAASRRCSLVDISHTGARLVLETADELPEQFTLLFAANGPHRLCRQVWRDGPVAGVEFIRPPAGAG
jgi:hypothetical protein